MKLKFLFLFALLALSSCSRGGAKYIFYVVMKPEQGPQFIKEMVAIAKANGLRAEVSKIRDDAGHVYNSIDGWALGINLLAQSAILSGREDEKVCGKAPEAYPDPAQFMVFTQPGFLFGSNAAATELGKRVHSQLQKSGFDVRLKQPICGAAAIDEKG